MVKPIEIELNIDGKKVIATLDLTNEKMQQLYAIAKEFESEPLLEGFKNDLLEISVVNDEAVESINEFISINKISETQLQRVRRELEMQRRLLPLNGKEYQDYTRAIELLSRSTMGATAATAGMRHGLGGMHQLMSQTAFMVSDLDMFMVNWQMGIRSVSNNLVMMANIADYTFKEMREKGVSMSQAIKQSMTGLSGVMMGLSVGLLALQILPVVFDKINSSSKKAAEEGLKKFTEQLQNMTTQQIKDALKEIEERIKNINEENEKRIKIASAMGDEAALFAYYSGSAPSDEDLNKQKQLNEELEKRNKKAATLIGHYEIQIADLDKEIEQLQNIEGAEQSLQVLVDRKAQIQAKLNDLMKTTQERLEDQRKELEKMEQILGRITNKIMKQTLVGIGTVGELPLLGDVSVLGAPLGQIIDEYGNLIPISKAKKEKIRSPQEIMRDYLNSPEQRELMKNFEAYQRIWDNIGKTIAGAFSRGIMMGQRFGDVLSNIAEQAMGMLASAFVYAGLGTIFGAGGFGTLFTKFFGFADGGLIPEPVIGRGLRSGAMYTFGERGAEYVIPNHALRNMQPAQINIKVGGEFEIDGWKMKALIKRIDKLEKRVS